jgi:hypothetical protein
MSLGRCELCQKQSSCACLTRARARAKAANNKLIPALTSKVKGSRDGIWRRK